MIPWSRIFNVVLVVALIAVIAYKAEPSNKASAEAATKAQNGQPQITLLLPSPADPRIGPTCGWIHEGLERCIDERFNGCRQKGNPPEVCKKQDTLIECYELHNVLLIQMAEGLCQENSGPRAPRPQVDELEPCEPAPTGSNRIHDLLAGLRNKRRLDSNQNQRRIRPNLNSIAKFHHGFFQFCQRRDYIVIRLHSSEIIFFINHSFQFKRPPLNFSTKNFILFTYTGNCSSTK